MGLIVQNLVDDYGWELLQTLRLGINAKTKVLFKTRAAYDRVAQAYPVGFPHGLLRQLWSENPPTLEFFKKLRTPKGKYCKWGVYAHILEKRGQCPKIYIGVDTAKDSGVRTRLRDYELGSSIPLHVGDALRDGYEITHTGLLCWSDIPPVTSFFEVRARFLVLESLFTAMFFACYCCQAYDSYWLSIFPWRRQDTEYEPLCGSLLSVMERIRREELSDLTPAQRQEVYDLRAEKSRQRMREYDPIYKKKRIAKDRDQ